MRACVLEQSGSHLTPKLAEPHIEMATPTPRLRRRQSKSPNKESTVQSQVLVREDEAATIRGRRVYGSFGLPQGPAAMIHAPDGSFVQLSRNMEEAVSRALNDDVFGPLAQDIDALDDDGLGNDNDDDTGPTVEKQPSPKKQKQWDAWRATLVELVGPYMQLMRETASLRSIETASRPSACACRKRSTVAIVCVYFESTFVHHLLEAS